MIYFQKPVRDDNDEMPPDFAVEVGMIYRHVSSESLRFQKSFDWLMFVVKKLGYGLKFDEEDMAWNFSQNMSWQCGDTMLEGLYRLCVEYVNFKNKQIK